MGVALSGIGGLMNHLGNPWGPEVLPRIHGRGLPSGGPCTSRSHWEAS